MSKPLVTTRTDENKATIFTFNQPSISTEADLRAFQLGITDYAGNSKEKRLLVLDLSTVNDISPDAFALLHKTRKMLGRNNVTLVIAAAQPKIEGFFKAIEINAGQTFPRAETVEGALKLAEPAAETHHSKTQGSSGSVR